MNLKDKKSYSRRVHFSHHNFGHVSVNQQSLPYMDHDHPKKLVVTLGPNKSRRRTRRPRERRLDARRARRAGVDREDVLQRGHGAGHGGEAAAAAAAGRRGSGGGRCRSRRGPVDQGRVDEGSVLTLLGYTGGYRVSKMFRFWE